MDVPAVRSDLGTPLVSVTGPIHTFESALVILLGLDVPRVPGIIRETHVPSAAVVLVPVNMIDQHSRWRIHNQPVERDMAVPLPAGCGEVTLAGFDPPVSADHGIILNIDQKRVPIRKQALGIAGVKTIMTVIASAAGEPSF